MPVMSAPRPAGFFLQRTPKDPKLDVRVWRPAEGVQVASSLVVVLTHQYSLLGGCQDLMQGIAHNLYAAGVPCVTFDMRGVGKSAGRATITGRAEVHDVNSVCNWAAQNFNRDVLLVGSSAGAPIAGSAVDGLASVKGYVGVGYTFGYLAAVLFGSHFKNIIESPKPKLFVMGTKDGFTSVPRFEAVLKLCKGVAKKHLVPNVGHFELEGSQYDQLISELIIRFMSEVQSSSSRPGSE